MKASVKFLASDLKKELIYFGVEVLRCAQNGSNALITIKSDLDNQSKFISFCEANNYAGTCARPFRKNQVTTQKYIDYGNIFKFVDL